MEQRSRVQPGRIVVLNGVPRAGKSSITAALQEWSRAAWVNLGVDVQRLMTPPRYQPGVGLPPKSRITPPPRSSRRSTRGCTSRSRGIARSG